MRPWPLVSLLLVSCAVPPPQGEATQDPPAPSAGAEQGVSGRAGEPAEAASRPTPDDGRSVESLVAALYEVLSGPRDRARDWDRFRALFCPDAVLATLQKDRGGTLHGIRLTPAQYVERSGTFVEREGMFEKQVAHVVERYGAIASVFSTYELRLGTPDGPPRVRGINAIQCFREEGRWRIQSVVWDSEPTAGPIPGRYLDEGEASRSSGGDR